MSGSVAVSSPPLLEMRAIEKRFGDVYANRGVDLSLRAGEVLGLLGENGAGKTTLMNILFGMYSVDAGSIRIGGEALSIHSPADALAHGVGMVHQHFHLVPGHTVLENLMVGAPGRHGMLDSKGMRARVQAIGAQYGLHLACDARVGDLSVGEQQRVEIVKALVRGARILILDEPTSVLTPQQSEGLFAALRALTADGVGIIFISHKLKEVLDITDRLAIMRHGRMVAEMDNNQRRSHNYGNPPGDLTALKQAQGEIDERETKSQAQGSPHMEKVKRHQNAIHTSISTSFT